MAAPSEQAPAWKMPGPSMERLAQCLEEDPSLADLMPLPEVRARLGEAGCCVDMIKAACEGYADRTALTWCRRGSPTPDYTERLTYRALWERVAGLATALVAQRGLLRRGQFLAICGFASTDWVVADAAGIYACCPSVPLPLNCPFEDVRFMLDETEAAVVFCALEEMPTILRVLAGVGDGAGPAVHAKTLVIMDAGGSVAEGAAAVARVKADHAALLEGTALTAILSMEELVEGAVDQPTMPPAVPTGPDELLGLMYTSGSTGRPKGAMYTDRLIGHLWAAGFSWTKGEVPTCSLLFLPLNHIVGRVTVYQTLSKGGIIYVVREPDMSTLFDDMVACRPTSMMLVPRILNMAYETYKLKRAGLLVAAGLVESEEDDAPKREEIAALDRQARDYVRDKIFGGRLLFQLVGSAPSSPEVMECIRDCNGVPFVEGYGSTECGGITIDNHINPNTVEAWKLVDAPELGYTTRDQPFPRGELLVRTNTSIPGYYKNPKATAELIDAEGLYHTGDIMEQRGPDELWWLDRRKNVLKLSQGEYVSVSRLEAVFGGHHDVQQAYVYGNSHFSYLLAVLVPSAPLLEAARAATGKQRDDGDDEALAEWLKPHLRRALEATAKEAGLAAYEVPRDFLVHPEGFTRENHLMTDSNKLARARCKALFVARLDALYTALEERRLRRIEEVERRGAEASPTEQVRAALEMTLGVAGDAVDLAAATFGQLGGDSLSAVRVVEHLRRLSGVAIPVAELLNPAATLGALVARIEAGAAGVGSGNGEEGDDPLGAATPDAVYRRVHGLGADALAADAEVIYAKDLTLDKFVPASMLSPPAAGGATDWAARAASPDPPRSVLLTGANGFLGRFLLLELMQRVPGRVFCLVRARDDAAARGRLLGALGPAEGEGLRGQVERLSGEGDRLVVWAGDVSRSLLGLSAEAYAALGLEVDTVLHAGALVNHTLSYAELFGPNVLGTARIVRFCLSTPARPKHLHFVSTVAVAMGAGGPNLVTEAHLGSHWAPERRTGGSYAGGYGASKWASECLLQDLRRRTGLPCAAYRCSMILPHTRLPGQINAADVFTRLLAGAIYTGLAPESFTDGKGRAPHYDGSPVDFVAGGIAALTCARGEAQAAEEAAVADPLEPRLYHVVSPHMETGATLDDILGWIRSAGFPLEEAAPYEVWFQAFKARLEALPPEKRTQSPLPVLHQWSRPLPPASDGALVLDAARFRAAVARLTPWRDVPGIDEGYIHACLYHMSVLGLISPTPAVAAAGERMVAAQGNGNGVGK